MRRAPGPVHGLSGCGVKPGTRVAVDDEHGVIVAPTTDELAYAATEYDGMGPQHGHVLVQFDGDEDWDRGWYAADEVRVLPASP